MRTRSKSKTGPSKLSIVTEPAEFFRSQINDAIQRQKLTADIHTELYLVDLLTRFMFADNLFQRDENGNAQTEVLALQLGQALTTDSLGDRTRSLQRLGDVSLYTAGFFADSLSRKIVDIEYYIGMGRTAYGHLAKINRDELFRSLFSTLSEKFDRFVDVLAEVSTTSGSKDNKNIVRLYELWLKTQSEHAEKGLKKAGINPQSAKKLKPGWQ